MKFGKFIKTVSLILVVSLLMTTSYITTAAGTYKISKETQKQIDSVSENESICILVEIKSEFNKSEFESEYNSIEEYRNALCKYFEKINNEFAEKLPAYLKSDIVCIDKYASVIWFDTTVENIYKLSEFDDVTSIDCDNYTLIDLTVDSSDYISPENYPYFPYIRGDVDGNGNVEISDARIILQYCAKLNNNVYVIYSDVNCDGKTDVKDARKILRAVAKLETI